MKLTGNELSWYQTETQDLSFGAKSFLNPTAVKKCLRKQLSQPSHPLFNQGRQKHSSVIVLVSVLESFDATNFAPSNSEAIPHGQGTNV